MAQNTFQFRRFSLFMLRQVRLNLPSFLLGFGSLFGILLLISLTTAYLNPEGMADLVSFYLFSFWLTGLVLTSRAFGELNNPKKSWYFFILPVSALEKLLALWLLTSPVFTVLYFLMVDVAFQLSLLKTGNMRLLHALFNRETFSIIGNYFVLQTIFFLGASTFRSNSFFKTLLALLLFILIVGFFSLTIMWAIFKGNFDIHLSFNTNISGQLATAYTMLTAIYPLLAPFFLLVSYYKLKERQV